MAVHRRRSREENQVQRVPELNDAEASVRINMSCPTLIKTNLPN